MTITDIPVQPHQQVWTLTMSFVAARAVHLVAEAGIADHIDEQPIAVDTLAARCGVDPDSLDRLLALLCSHGLFERTEAGYRHTPASRLLRSAEPTSMRPFARMIGLPLFWSSFASLERSLRSGEPAVADATGTDLWGYLQAHPAEAALFGEAMTAKARADIAAVLGAYDFRPFRTIADIGGGRGHLLQAILAAVPTARGVLFDLPSVIATTDVASDRLVTSAGDFFVDPLPHADGYLLMEILHDWPDREATTILRAVRNAAPAGSVLLIVESVLGERGKDPYTHSLDVLMLAVTGGRERTAAELAMLLQRAGFRQTATLEAGGSVRIVEAVAI